MLGEVKREYIAKNVYDVSNKLLIVTSFSVKREGMQK